MLMLINYEPENYISGCNKILDLFKQSDTPTTLIDIKELSLHNFKDKYPEITLVYFLVASHPLLITYTNALALMGVRVINAAYFSRATNKYLTQQLLDDLHIPIPSYRLWRDIDDTFTETSVLPCFLKSFSHSVPVIKIDSFKQLDALQDGGDQYTEYYLEDNAGDSSASYVKCYAAFGRYSINNPEVAVNSMLKDELERIGGAFGLECFSVDMAIYPDGSHKFFDINYASAFYGSDEARSQLVVGIQSIIRQPAPAVI